MYKFSFKIKHRNCSETELSEKFPAHHITVIDIQSKSPSQKQYFYYITGKENEFGSIISYLTKSGYKEVREVERSKETLLLLVVLNQKSYVQNIIQKYKGFFIDLHTASSGYEYWHVGTVSRQSIDRMLIKLKAMGDVKVLSIGQVEFENAILSRQQKNVFTHAYEQGYYTIPRKTTIAAIAHDMGLSSATAGEHLLRAENKLINLAARKL